MYRAQRGATTQRQTLERVHRRRDAQSLDKGVGKANPQFRRVSDGLAYIELRQWAISDQRLQPLLRDRKAIVQTHGREMRQRANRVQGGVRQCVPGRPRVQGWQVAAYCVLVCQIHWDTTAP